MLQWGLAKRLVVSRAETGRAESEVVQAGRVGRLRISGGLRSQSHNSVLLPTLTAGHSVVQLKLR